jgi:hypothetical protein
MREKMDSVRSQFSLIEVPDLEWDRIFKAHEV